MTRVFNFSAGPATLPVPVLEQVRDELLDWRGTGMSVMEMSHRDKPFMSIAAEAEAGHARAVLDEERGVHDLRHFGEVADVLRMHDRRVLVVVLGLDGFFVLLCCRHGFEQTVHVIVGEAHHAVFIAHDPVAGLNDLAAHTHCNIDFARAVFVGATVDGCLGVARKVGVLKCRDIANRAINHKSCTTPLHGIQHDQFAHERVVAVATTIDHQHLTGLHVHQRFVDHEVVTRSAFDGDRTANQLARVVKAMQPHQARHALQVVAQMGCDDVLKCFGDI